jgi:hypothetical protein
MVLQRLTQDIQKAFKHFWDLLSIGEDFKDFSNLVTPKIIGSPNEKTLHMSCHISWPLDVFLSSGDVETLLFY